MRVFYVVMVSLVHLCGHVYNEPPTILAIGEAGNKEIGSFFSGRIGPGAVTVF